MVVADQSGAAVNDAKVSVTNTATGAARETPSSVDGSATFSALSLTGAYTVKVPKSGFGDEQAAGIVLRSGETAMVRVKLNVGSATGPGYRLWDRRRRARRSADWRCRPDGQIDELPVMGRKLAACPCLTPRTARERVSATVYQPALRRHRRRLPPQPHHHGGRLQRRRCMGTAVRHVHAAHERGGGDGGADDRFFFRIRMDVRPALNIVTKSGTKIFTVKGCGWAAPGTCRRSHFRRRAFAPSPQSTCTTPSTLTSISPVDMPDKLNQFSGALGGRSSRIRRSSS